jgi:hypothetical protein
VPLQRIPTRGSGMMIRVYLTRIACVLRFSRPLDAFIRPVPAGPVSCQIRSWGSSPSELCSPREAVRRLQRHSPHDVLRTHEHHPPTHQPPTPKHGWQLCQRRSTTNLRPKPKSITSRHATAVSSLQAPKCPPKEDRREHAPFARPPKLPRVQNAPPRRNAPWMPKHQKRTSTTGHPTNLLRAEARCCQPRAQDVARP